jgi:hypothetical protein
MLTSVENYVVILHILMELLFFQICPFLLYKANHFVRIVDLCFSCSFHFIMVSVYELRF